MPRQDSHWVQSEGWLNAMILEGLFDMMKCLIVSDGEGGGRELEGLLSAYGFKLAHVPSVSEARETCRGEMPDVIVMPHGSHEQSYISLIKWLRRGREANSPAILIYGEQGDADILGQAIWEGASELIMKPFDAGILDQKLRQIGAI